MANIKSAQKRIRITDKKTARNTSIKSALKTSIKKFNLSANEASENSKELLNAAMKSLDKAASKGIIHKNTAARKKSRLSARLNKAMN